MAEPHPLTVLPFVALLASIAGLPLLAPKFWSSNRNRALVTFGLAAPVALWIAYVDVQALLHTLGEYVSFILLLGALFTVSGGVHVRGDLRGTPVVNLVVFGLGGVLANLLGTTGASMLLIRPLLRTNAQRERVAHLPFFFILIVSNCGGLLTPLGDPPLFLGYLRGVPFDWTLRLWPVWLFAMVWLLGLCYALDVRAYRSESREAKLRDERERVALGVDGWRQLPLLALVIGAVFLSSPLRELTLLGCALVSAWIGPKRAHRGNHFEFAPLIEVAVLFAGIFVTMLPALALLRSHGRALGLSEAWHFFLVTGALSSLLDNAPTYLTFLSAAQALGERPDVIGVPHTFLAAISVGAVVMGANTYIGNGPNFMVKAIAESANYRMPSFARYALLAFLTLIPVYVFTMLWLAQRVD
ncbi:MAG: sodium:proton antiporter [Myxococcota bacterium]